jgi:hypothetical protein
MTMIARRIADDMLLTDLPHFKETNSISVGSAQTKVQGGSGHADSKRATVRPRVCRTISQDLI